MKVSKMFFKTYREAPADAELTSHKLLVRAGYIKKQSAGIYIYMPLGLRVLKKIENIVREEMDKIGCVELSMPKLMTEDVYALRIETFGNSMFRLKDRNGKPMCLGPTHEEAFTLAVKDNITSYKQLPITLYQIGEKFRDEVRPRFGLQRAKEFIMKDAYSYHVDQASLDEVYEDMKQAYCRIFDRLGLDYVPVFADNGAMGGSGSQEFMVKSTVGEDEIAYCPHCNYAANVEKAEVVVQSCMDKVKELPMEKVHTPNMKTIQQLVEYFGKEEKDFLKAVVYNADGKIVVALCRGDREIEEVKLANYLGVNADSLAMATHEQIQSIGSVAGFVGANTQLKNVLVVADQEVKNMHNFIMGANEFDYHYENVNLKDLVVKEYIDLRKIVKGDVCPHCHTGKIEIIRGIEVGHIFKLGTRYTKALDCKFLDENGKSQVMQMGCYGIGVSRALSACVEQHNDEKGIIWPESIAPYQVLVVVANYKEQVQNDVAEQIYNALQKKNVEVLLDDRKESAGVKFKDAELIGVPNIVIVGRKAPDGIVEYENRITGQKEEYVWQDIVNRF